LKRKTLAALVSLIMVISVNGTVVAAPSLNSSKTPQEQRQDLQIKIEKLDTEISDVMYKIDDNNKGIDKSNKEIKIVEDDIKKSEENIKSQQDLFNERVSAMYISGSDSYLSVILESNGISDFISRVESVKKIIGFDQKVMADLKTKEAVIAQKKEALKAENTKILALKAENEKTLASLNKDKSDMNNLLGSIKVFAYIGEGDSSEVSSAQSQIAAIRQNTQSYVPSRGSASLSGSAAVAYASNFLGTPYQWGANGPNTFDCSGFTSYVYSHFGKGLPRTAASQQSVGVSVDRANLQPGDLVFFGSPAHHVGIYVGNGCYIHAPKTGDVVKISPLNRSDYSGARRIIN
jgi:peptidoglycan hydrolase CwlO-like protein